MTWWRTLSVGCWFSHEFIRDRDERGRLILVCANCSYTRTPDLDLSDDKKGPAHTPVEPLGRATGKAVRATWFQRRKVS